MRVLLVLWLVGLGAWAAEKPNVLWLFQEDTSPWIGCYDYAANKGKTPNIDKMASEGVRFSRAYVPAPVCSSCRSAVITGAMQFRFGAHEHRSRRGAAGVALPTGMKTLPELFREQGYATFNVGKTDYNFTHGAIYDAVKGKKAPWREVKQPFFGQIQLKGGKTNTNKFPAARKADPAQAVVPADYPQDEMHRKIVAQHCDAVRSDDDLIGEILKTLAADGLDKNTIVVYFSDHGANHLVRHKQQPTEAGLHVPCVMVGPEKWVPKGVVRDDLISILDVSATTLSWAGIAYPKWVEGRNLFAADFQPRSFVGSGRDRCDHTIERIRTVRTDRFRYTRNYLLDRVLLQPQYRDNKDYVKALRTSYAAGTLAPKLAEIYFGERPAEELYDMTKDPAQVNNLAASPTHQAVLAEHRAILGKWLAAGDLGAGEEPEVEMEMNGNGRFHGVNPEYERVRTDSDGDGLSDRWETFNDRDPKDGKLQFEFDCGGWQTEGWTATGLETNIAGSQGFLDFELPAGTAVLSRAGLRVDAGKNAGPLVIRCRSSKPIKIAAKVKGELVGSASCVSGDFVETEVPLGEEWAGTIASLELAFDGPAGATVEIDWIRAGQK